MSWETFTVGYVSFRDDTPVEVIDQAIAELKEVLQCDLEWDPERGEWKFQDVNWTSHVSGDRVEEVYEKYKEWWEEFAFSLYYLNEADEEIYFSRSDNTEYVFTG